MEATWMALRRMIPELAQAAQGRPSGKESRIGMAGNLSEAVRAGGKGRFTGAMIILVAVMVLSSSPLFGAEKCPPTEPDSLGPFYKPNAPERSRIGAGYALSGVVRSSTDCRPLANARIEIWQAGPDRKYDDAHRATLYSDSKGQYRLETDFPPRYSFWRPSHIHILVEAPGFRRLVTQYYPKKGAKEGTFDLVLVPAK